MTYYSCPFLVFSQTLPLGIENAKSSGYKDYDCDGKGKGKGGMMMSSKGYEGDDYGGKERAKAT
jgi:hypothetical protein